MADDMAVPELMEYMLESRPWGDDSTETLRRCIVSAFDGNWMLTYTMLQKFGQEWADLFVDLLLLTPCDERNLVHYRLMESFHKDFPSVLMDMWMYS